jgi:hypothetical protein
VAGNFFKYMGPLKEGEYLPRKVEELPVDAHSLIALCAPRPVFLNGGTTDSWSDPYGTYLAGKGATPVYELLGKNGVVMNDRKPKVDVAYISGSIGYRVHEGGHTDVADWPAFFDFAANHIHASVLKTPADYITMTAGDNSTTLLRIESNEKWRVANMQKWLTLNKTSSSGNDSIVLTATPNTGASARTATLVITSEGMKQVVIVNQAANNPTLSISRDALTIGDAANSTAALGITSNTAWSIITEKSWLNADCAGVNNKTIILTADRNASVVKRTTRVTIIAEGVEPQTVTITQREGPASLYMNKRFLNFGAAAERNTNNYVQSNTDWTIEFSEPWLKANQITGKQGFTVVTISADENPSTERNATVTVTPKGGKPWLIKVKQAAKN